MSRAAVRSAIVSYLDPNVSNVTHLSNVFAHPAKFTNEGEFYDKALAGTASGALIFVYLSRQTDEQIAYDGSTNGEKATTHEVVLDCFFRSTHKRSEDAGADNDDFIDSLISRIRADRNGGAPSVIWQWGMGRVNGGADNVVQSFYPKLLKDGAVTEFYTRITVTAMEVGFS